MREIKFRMFFDATGYADKFPDHPEAGQKRMIEWDELLLEADDPIRAYFNNEIAGCSPLIQYTGLKDKNGKEIYEGDICQFDNGDKFKVSCEDWVEFYADWIGEPECSDQTRDFYRIRNSEIIGNLYENPELLNG